MNKVDEVAVGVGEVLDAADDRGGHRAGLNRLLVEVHALDALLDVQRAGGAVGLLAVVVVDAVGHVAGLLGLEDHRAALDGVDGAGVDLEEVALVDGHLVEQIGPAALVDHLLELGGVLGLLADDDGAALLAAEDVPAFLLAQRAVLVLLGVLVVGVDLDREVILGVEDLDEQGELLGLAATAVGNGAEYLAVALPDLRKVLAVERAADDLAIAVGVRRDGPALADRAIGDLVTPVVRELAPAPDLLVEDRLEENQLMELLRHCCSFVIGYVVTILAVKTCAGR